MSSTLPSNWLDAPFDLIPKGKQPLPMPGATWQPGVIDGSNDKRVFLNGEPIAGAIAASDIEGWVLITGERNVEQDHGLNMRPAGTKKIEGRVEIRDTRW